MYQFLAREWSRVVSLNRFKIYLIFIIFMYIFKIKKLAKKILKNTLKGANFIVYAARIHSKCFFGNAY